MSTANYEYVWNTVTQEPGVDANGNPITVTVKTPNSFIVYAIPENIARALRAGLNREATKNHTIADVAVKQVTESRADLTGLDP